MSRNSKKRLVFKKGEQKLFLDNAISLSKCKSIREFSEKYDIPSKTFQGWLYEYYTLPKNLFERIIETFPSLEKFKKCIEEEKEQFWGQKKGGKRTIKTIIKKYGHKELKRRQRIGGQRAGQLTRKRNKINIKTDSNFYEFLGALFGDGCLSKYKYRNKTIRVIVITGNKKDERDYYNHLQDIIEHITNRRIKIKESKTTNKISLTIQCYSLFDFLVKKFNFPVGEKKEKLEFPNQLPNSTWLNISSFIKGVFDTDGSLYFDKNNSSKYYYPITEICMEQKKFLDQIRNVLSKRGFKTIRRSNVVRLKGKKNLRKWMERIGTNNIKHRTKYEVWRKYGECPPNKIFPLNERLKLLRMPW